VNSNESASSNNNNKENKNSSSSSFLTNPCLDESITTPNSNEENKNNTSNNSGYKIESKMMVMKKQGVSLPPIPPFKRKTEEKLVKEEYQKKNMEQNESNE
jgi:hypothetical protein